MNTSFRSIPDSLVIEYKRWQEDEFNKFEVCKWGNDFYALKHLVKKDNSFIEKEIRAVTKAYYNSIPQPIWRN